MLRPYSQMFWFNCLSDFCFTFPSNSNVRPDQESLISSCSIFISLGKKIEPFRVKNKQEKTKKLGLETPLDTWYWTSNLNFLGVIFFNLWNLEYNKYPPQVCWNSTQMTLIRFKLDLLPQSRLVINATLELFYRQYCTCVTTVFQMTLESRIFSLQNTNKGNVATRHFIRGRSFNKEGPVPRPNMNKYRTDQPHPTRLLVFLFALSCP